MAKKNDAKRAAKKHAKEKKRQKKVAEKRATLLPRERDPLADWKPAVHGIEGLARLLRTDSHDAAVLADHMAKGGRKDAKAAWIPARVRALSTDALLAELAARGIVIDEASFVALAAGYESARVLAAETWGPLLAEATTVHDRDLVGQAAEVLWERWLPTRPTDEDLRDRMRDIHDLEDDGDATLEAVEKLLDEVSYERLARVWDEARLDFDLHTFFAQSPSALEDAAAAEPRVRKAREAVPAGSYGWEGATLCLARLAEDAESGVSLLLDAAEAHPPRIALLAEATDILLYEVHADELVERALAAMRAAVELLEEEDDRGFVEDLIEELEAARAEVDEGEPGAFDEGEALSDAELGDDTDETAEADRE